MLKALSMCLPKILSVSFFLSFLEKMESKTDNEFMPNLRLNHIKSFYLQTIFCDRFKISLFWTILCCLNDLSCLTSFKWFSHGFYIFCRFLIVKRNIFVHRILDRITYFLQRNFCTEKFIENWKIDFFFAFSKNPRFELWEIWKILIESKMFQFVKTCRRKVCTIRSPLEMCVRECQMRMKTK